MATSARNSLFLIIVLGIPALASSLRYPQPSGPPQPTANGPRRRQTASPRRYYATWEPARLCSAKATFDAWEDSYGSLEECCDEVFAWDYAECLKSDQ
ncbi:hypothetical protein ACHAWF_001999 [Thalassiosira exigua]